MWKKNQDKTNQSRRNLLKLTAFGMVAGIGLRTLSGVASAWAAPMDMGGKKALIVYYSRSGNTRAAAKLLRGLTGAEMVELETVEPYPSDYRATTEQAKKELESGFKPQLKTKIENLADYDVIFLGSPCWWGTVATPVITFLTENDLSGKTIAEFMTHGGSGLGRSISHLREMCPKSTVTEGLAISGSSAASAQGDIKNWLLEIGLGK